MQIVMQSNGLLSGETPVCAYCGKRASFLSPIGPLCTTDALLAAAFSDWIPTPMRECPPVAPVADR